MTRRRTKGTGSIKLRGRVYWIQIKYRGQRLRESAHTSDPEQAASYLASRIGEVAGGADVVPSKATIADLCQIVIADYKTRELRNEKGIRWLFEANVDRLIGSLQAARFGSNQIRTYIAARKAEGASNATINREFAMVRRGYTLGMQEEPPLVRRAPHIPKLEESEPRQGFIEQEQYELLLAHMPEHLKCLLVVGYHFGCRLGEFRKLRWDQVDLGAGEIRLERKQTKGKAPRVLPFYDDEVRGWMERQREFSTGERVFCWKQNAKRGVAKEKGLGSHLKGWDRACEEAGLPGLLFHDLRRSAVRNMERAGIPRSVAMRISGHKTESVYKRYDIVSEGDLKEAARKMEAFKKSQKKAKLRMVK
jgi:integrase